MESEGRFVHPASQTRLRWARIPSSPIESVRSEESFVDAPQPTMATRRELARDLLRQELNPEFGEVSFVQQCPTCGKTDHGPLTVRLDSASSFRARRGARIRRDPGRRVSRGSLPRVSVTYTDASVIVAIAPREATAFGIDAEIKSPRKQAAAGEALAMAPSAEAVVEWTRLEAIAKARGTGLRGDWQHPDAAAFECYSLELVLGATATMIAIALQPVSRIH